MNPYWLIAALVIGFALGVFYFGGLWLTVRRLPKIESPALWLLLSFVIRMTVLLGGLYLVMGGRWERLLAGLGGVLLARVLLIRRLRYVGQVANLPTA